MKAKIRTNFLEAKVQSSNGIDWYDLKYDIPENQEEETNDEQERIWICSCPAGQHGRLCKHVKLVSDIVESLKNYTDELALGNIVFVKDF